MRLSRRLILAGLLAGLAFFSMTTPPATAQGKKSSGGDDMSRLIGIDGAYTSQGRNPDGSVYQGRADITQQGDAVEITWVIDGNTIRGAGEIDGRVVTVDWGDATPVVYVVMPDGALHGTWADGTALDKLTPR